MNGRNRELNEVFAGVHGQKGLPRHVPALPSRRAKPAQLGLLLLGILVVIGGVAYTVFSELQGSDDPAISAAQDAAASAAPRLHEEPRFSLPAVPSRTREFLRALEIDGKPAEFFAIEKLNLRADGKAQIITVLLRAQLDSYTEEIWKQSGMFADEAMLASPLLRTVTVAHTAALENLCDWHVEAVSLVTLKSVQAATARSAK